MEDVAILYFWLNLNPFFLFLSPSLNFQSNVLLMSFAGFNFLKYVFVLYFEVFEENFFMTLGSVQSEDQGPVFSIFAALMVACSS